MNIIFAGTPDIAAIVLQALLKTEHKLIAVLTQPDKPQGRGNKILPSPVKVLAEQRGIPVYQPANLRDPDMQETLRSLQPDLMIVLAYGLLFPQAVLDIPTLGCLNIHTSLLPHYRGSAPVQRAILSGGRTTGISFMRMDAGLDTGPVYVQFQCNITPEDTSTTLLNTMAHKAAEELPDFLVALEQELISPVPQNDSHASQAHKILKEEGCVQWKESAEHMERMIRAFDPWPGVHSFYQGERIRLLRAQVLPDNGGGKPGQIMQFAAEGLDIACGKGLLRVQALQMPGKNPLPTSALVNGYHDFFAVGDFFVETLNK